MYINIIFILMPFAGSMGGGQVVTIIGTGFDAETVVKICTVVCERTGSSTSQQLMCTVPASGNIINVK